MSEPTHPSKNFRKIGIAQVLLSGFCFGFLGVFGKTAYSKGVEPFELLSLRFLTGGVLLAGFFLITNPGRLRVTFKQLLLCAAFGGLGYATFSSFYFLALKGLSASLTVLLLYLYPVMVAAGAWAAFGERIPPSRWLVFPMAILGVTLLVWGDFTVSNWVAFAYGAASALFYAIYILVSSRLLKNVNPYTASTYNQLFAGLALALLAWRDPARFTHVVSEIWPMVLAMGIVCSIAAMSLFLAGLSKLKSWEASILSIAEPVTAILMAVAALGESFTALQAAGAVLAIAALVVVSLPSRAKA